MRFHTSTRSRYLGLAAMAASLAVPLLSPGQSGSTQAMGQLLSESARIGDPTGPAAAPDLWVRSIARLRLSADGFVVFQKGHRLRSLNRSNFDPAAPFCVIDVETSAPSAHSSDPEMEAGEQRRASVVPMRDNPVDLGPYHLSTDLLLVVAQGDPWTIQFGFMWPHEAGSPAPARRSTTVADLHTIVGPEFDFGTGGIAQPANRPTFGVTTFDLSFELLVLDESRTNARTDIRDDQIQVFEGCTPVRAGSCKPVAPLQIDRASTTGGGVNFIVLPEIGGEASQNRIVRDAVGRLADFAKPQDRLAIVPYYARPVIWQPLTGAKDVYKARAALLFNADVGAGAGSINTRSAVATALTEVAGKVEPKPAGSPADFPQRNVILIMTEGNYCLNAYEIAKMAAEHNASIWVLDLTGRNHGELKPLAEMSGGVYFRVDGYEDLLAHMDKFVKMWNQVYLISYTPSPPDQDGKPLRREIRVTRSGGTDLEKVSLIVSKGFHGPQVVANMLDLESYYVPEPKFTDVRSVSDLFRFIHRIDSDSDFPGFVLKAIQLARSPGEFFGFLDRIEHIVTPKRRKTIGHLITAKLEAFRAMKPPADDWMKLRSSVGNAEDWKQVTEAFMPELKSADLFLRALKVDEAPGAPEYTEEVRAMLPGIALANLSRFASLMPSDSQKDSLVALLPNKEQKIQARVAFGMPPDQAAREIARTFQEFTDPARSFAFLQGLLCSAPSPAEFAGIVEIHGSAGSLNSKEAASDAVLSCLKRLASFSSPQATIPIALQTVQGCRGRVAVVRDLKGSISQVNQLKEENAEDGCLQSLYLLGVRQARSAEELAAALSIPETAWRIDYEKLRDGVIQSLLPEFQRDARPAADYLVLADKARAIALKIAVLNAGLPAPGDPAVKQQLKSALDQLQGGRMK